MIRILLADPRLFVRVGLQAVLQPLADLQLLEAVGGIQSAPRLCRQLSADLLLVNPSLFRLQIESLLAEMSTIAPSTQVLLSVDPGQTPSPMLHKLLQTGGVVLFYQTIHLICTWMPCAQSGKATSG